MSGVGSIAEPRDVSEALATLPTGSKEPKEGQTPAKVAVTVKGRNAFVWNADDALLLRTKHHIVGSFIGSLPRSPQQNIFFSLPLSLLPEELYVLIQEELCTLQEDLGSHATPSANEIAAYEADAQEWAKSLQRTRAEAIVAQREAHLGSQRKDKGSAPTSAPDGSGTDQIRGTLATESDQAASALDVKSDPDSAHMRVWSHSSKLPWYRPQIQGRDFFPFPLSTEDKRRSQIFYDLWKKGMYLSSGSKFGANYLGYPGDPLRYHSNFIVSVVGSDTKIPLMDIVTIGRLGTVVKKNRLIAVADEADQSQARYFSTEWTGWP